VDELELAIISLWALIAAAGGAVVAQIIQIYFTRRNERRQRRAELAAGPLWQVQDATESLWHRLENLKDRRGFQRMDNDYYFQSTAFLIAQFLASKRLLGKNGIYSQLEGRTQGDALRKSLETSHRQLFRLNNMKSDILRNDQTLLADLALEREAGGWYLVPFSEFRERVANASNAQFLKKLQLHLDHLKETHEDLARMKKCLEAAGEELSRHTGLAWAGASADRGDLTRESTNRRAPFVTYPFSRRRRGEGSRWN
jgi:hypothetical protein